MAGELVVESVAVTSIVSTEVNAITTYGYLAANSKLVAWGTVGSAGLGNIGYRLIRSRPITRIRAVHSWSRGPIYKAEQAMLNLNISTRFSEPFIPQDPTGIGGALWNVWKATPNHK